MSMKSKTTSIAFVVLGLIAASCGTSTSETASVAAEDSDDGLLVFCEEAPALTSGVRVTVNLMDELTVLIDAHVMGQDREDLVVEVSALREDLAAFEAGTGTAFDAGGVNGVIGQMCNLDLESEAVES